MDCAEQLTLHVRHRAWLAARPGKGKARKSRLEQFLADEEAGKVRSELILPPILAGDHLIEHLFSVGPSTAGEVITYQEIQAWTALTGHRLNGWEAETLRRLSGAYLSELQEAEDAGRPPPYSPAERVVPRAEVANRLNDIFARLEAKPDRGMVTEEA